jgi:hypothetical protein
MQLTFLTKKKRETHIKKAHPYLWERAREREREREREEFHDYNLIERGPFLNNLGNCLGVEDG